MSNDFDWIHHYDHRAWQCGNVSATIDHQWTSRPSKVPLQVSTFLDLQAELKSSIMFPSSWWSDLGAWLSSACFQVSRSALGPSKQEQLSSATPVGTPDASRTDDALPQPLLYRPRGTWSLACHGQDNSIGMFTRCSARRDWFIGFYRSTIVTHIFHFIEQSCSAVVTVGLLHL